MNNFLIRLLLRICFFTSSVLWGIMFFFQYKKHNSLESPPIYKDLEEFRTAFNSLSTYQQTLDCLTLHYDNFAVFFGGLFLVFYALKQKSELKDTKTKSFWSGILTVLLCVGFVYMALDWTENYSFYKANNPEFIFGPFKWVQLFKWVVGIMTLVALAFTDILLFRNWRGVLWGIFGFLLIIGLVSKSFGLYKNSISTCSTYSK